MENIMKKTIIPYMFFAGFLATILLTSCRMTSSLERPVLPPGIPDLTKGEGPTVDKAEKQWFLHCGRTHGWIYKDKNGKFDKARQILVTKIHEESSVRDKLKVGDVILGVNGKYFDKHAVYQFRESSLPAQRSEGELDIILWRKGWDKERVVTLDFTPKKLDFTKGDKPGLAVDWNLGPTGARGWFQGQYEETVLARQILITQVEKGSPADGILQKGDVILGVEGKKFNSDARKAFAKAITKAETEEGAGKLNVIRWRDGKTEDVTIPIKVMGSYSKTTPWNCEKSEKILDNACKYLIAHKVIEKDLLGIQSHTAALALMSTGNPDHLKIVKKHVNKLLEKVKKSGTYPPVSCYSAWDWGYANLMLTEYYLLTKDKKVLPAIRKYSECIAKGQSGAGSWGHRMATSNHGECHGYGALNQAGNICWISLLLAERCGVTSLEIKQAIARGKTFLETFEGIQPVPYGDHIQMLPNAHDDNGKCSAVACGFAMLGDKPGTEFFSRMTVASYAVREKGHTGSWWSALWGPLGASRAGQKGCSAFLHEMTWLYDLERRWDGGFVYQGKPGVGYGVDPKTGRQKGGREHNNAYWDTTGSRILMYTLPGKKLCITGKDVLTVDIPENQITEVIEAGRPTEKGYKQITERYDDCSEDELIELLGSWSPVVRHHASLSLAKKESSHTEQLIEMLSSKNKFERYGACIALQAQGEKSVDAVEPLLKMLNTKDPILMSYVIFALGKIGDKRAVKPLLKLGATEIPNDPRETQKRHIVRALFDRGGLLDESIDGVDKELLFSAVRSFLKSQNGAERSMVANKVLKKLKFDELQPLWSDLIPAMLKCAPSGVMFASGVREEIAKILAENKVKEGMELIFEYLKKQKRHGSSKRNKLITDLLKQYGANAKPLVPEMEKYLELCRKDHPWIDVGQPPMERFYKGQIPYIEETIKVIKESDKKPKLKSIKPYLK